MAALLGGAVPMGSALLRDAEHCPSCRVLGLVGMALVAEDAEMSAEAHIDGLNEAITFAKVIAEATARERERCIAAIEAQKLIFMSPEYATGQPLSSFAERMACDSCIDAIKRL